MAAPPKAERTGNRAPEGQGEMKQARRRRRYSAFAPRSNEVPEPARLVTGVFGICTQDGIHMRAGLLRRNEDRPRGLPMKPRFHRRLGSAADGADQKSVLMAIHQFISVRGDADLGGCL